MQHKTLHNFSVLWSQSALHGPNLFAVSAKEVCKMFTLQSSHSIITQLVLQSQLDTSCSNISRLDKDSQFMILKFTIIWFCYACLTTVQVILNVLLFRVIILHSLESLHTSLYCTVS